VVVVDVADVALLSGGECEACDKDGDLEESHGGMTRRAEGGEEVANTRGIVIALESPNPSS